MRIVVVAALLLAMSLAGCSGGETAPEQSTSSGTSKVQRDGGDSNDPSGTASDAARINGTVLNEGGLAIPDARVLLVTAGLTAITSAEGNFSFVDVPAGKESIRVERSGFRVFQEDIQVGPGERLSIEIVMIAMDSTEPGGADHIHDYWGGQASVVIMDDPVPLNDGQLYNSGTNGGLLAAITRANLDGMGSYQYRFDLPDQAAHPPPGTAWQPALVYPGSQRMEVTLTWDADDIDVSTLDFAFDSPARDQEWVGPVASGELVDIPLTEPQDADRGHMLKSRWSFSFRTMNNPTQGASWEPALALGDIHVKVEVFGGKAPLEPPHPRPWDASACLTLQTFANKVVPNPAGIVPQDRHSGNRGSLSLAEEGIVAPGATNMTITFRWTHNQVSATDDTPVDEWGLLFSAADQNHRTVPWDELRVPVEVSVDLAAQIKVYEIEIDRGWVDPWYDSRSNWRLFPIDETIPGGPTQDQLLPDWFLVKYGFEIHAVVCNRDLM